MKSCWLIILEKERWVGVLNRDERTLIEFFDVGPAAVDELIDWLKSNDYSSESVVLAVDSRLCLIDSIKSADVDASKKYEVLKFALEETLPWGAEDFEAHFFYHESSILGVAVSTIELQLAVDAFESNGIHIGEITASSVLIADWLRVKENADSIILDHDATEVIQFENAGIKEWNFFDLHDDQTGPAISDAVSLSQNCRYVSFNGERSLQDYAASQSNLIHDSSPDLDFYETCVAALALLRASKSQPTLAFRRGMLATSAPRETRRANAWLSTALIVLCASLAVCMLTRSWRYEQLADNYKSAQASIFTQVFPDSRIPSGVLTRLTSEHKRLTGASGSNDEMPSHISSLLLMRDFLLSLPTNTALRITEVRVDGETIRIDGEVKNHSDASEIAGKLRLAGFTVEPPTTRLLTGGEIAFGIDAVILLNQNSGSESTDQESISNQTVLVAPAGGLR